MKNNTELKLDTLLEKIKKNKGIRTLGDCLLMDMYNKKLKKWN